MNDEQFEAAMDYLGDEGQVSISQQLRARDTAQREALEQLRTERRHDAQIQSAMAADQKAAADALGIPSGKYSGGVGEQLLAIEKLREERDTAQAQLAEAVGLLRSAEHQLFSFHREHESQWCGYLDDALGVIKHIIGSNAQAEQQEAQGAQAGEFEREDLYIVIKRKDLDRLPMEMRLPFSMALNKLSPRLPKRECVVIESDWPEYEPTWAAIQARMTGQGAQAGDRQAKPGLYCRNCGSRLMVKGVCSIYCPNKNCERDRAALATQPDVRGAEHE